jgi:hypothetical protein
MSIFVRKVEFSEKLNIFREDAKSVQHQDQVFLSITTMIFVMSYKLLIKNDTCTFQCDIGTKCSLFTQYSVKNDYIFLLIL